MELWMNLPWKEIQLTSTFMLASITAVFLLINRYPATRYLGVLIISNLILSISILAQSSIPFVGSAIVLTAVVLTIYSRAFFIQNTRVGISHAIIVLVVIIVNSFPEIIPIESLIRLFHTIIVLGYLWSSFKTINKEATLRGISWFQNPGSRLVWFRNFFGLNIILIVSWLIIFNWLSVEIVLGGLFIQLAFIYSQIITESSFLMPIQLGNKYLKSTLTAEQKHAIVGKLDALFKNEKIFLDDSISLSSVASQLNTTNHHLSQVINETKGITFQKLISNYRIEEAKILLKDKQYEQTTIENIAGVVGYNSKSAFNTTFKKITGLTPTEYRMQDGVRPYREVRLPDRKLLFFEKLFVSLNHVLSINRMIMITNFLKIFARTLYKNKIFTAINLFGLTLGFTCSIFIYLFITDELSYDKQLPDSESIYRIAWINDNPQTRTPHPMALAMKDNFAEVVAATSISPWYGAGLNKQGHKVKNEKKDLVFEEPDFYFADSTFLDVFQLDVIAGDKDALYKPWMLILSRSMAKKYFGDEDAVGQKLMVDEMELEVAAVLKDMPKNSHFHFRGIISYVSLKTINPKNPWFKWGDFGHFNYIRTNEDVDYKLLESKIPDWVSPHLDWPEENVQSLKNGIIRFQLQPIQDIHLKSHLRWELENNGNILYVYIMIGTLAFLLLIVAINYINLTTAKSIVRAKEVGIRKTMGALPGQLKLQFYLESAILCSIALITALIIVVFSLDFLNHLTQRSFNLANIFNIKFALYSTAVFIIIVVVAGYYPAFALSSYQPTDILKDQLKSGRGTRLRGALVIVQFFVSAVLITGSVVIINQIDFMQNKELGFDQEAIITVKMQQSVQYGGLDMNTVNGFKNKFTALSGVKKVSGISNLPGEQFNQNPIFLKIDPTNRIDASEVFVDFDFQDVLGLELIKGRAYDRMHSDDLEKKSFIINETAASQLQLDDPIGKTIVWETSWENQEGNVIGVVKDFHFKSLHENINPLIIIIDPESINHLIVKLEGENFRQSLSEMENIHKSMVDDLPFEYHFLDNNLAKLYESEKQTLSIFSTFTAIALLLSCLGLLGMAIAILNQRIKEVGIRKILGASSGQIMGMIMGKFAKLISISLLFGIPVGYLLISEWVSEFSYQVDIGILPFITSSAILILIALASVSAVVLRIAYSNPVDSLRSE